MANKPKKAKKPSAASSSDSNVVRIKASTAPKPKKSDKKAEKSEVTTTKVVAAEPTKSTKKPKAEKAPKAPRKRSAARPLKAMRDYFVGAWVELRQVRWPNRRATWGMTMAVLIYSAFFVALILLLDAGFNYLFDLILGK